MSSESTKRPVEPPSQFSGIVSAGILGLSLSELCIIPITKGSIYFIFRLLPILAAQGILFGGIYWAAIRRSLRLRSFIDQRTRQKPADNDRQADTGEIILGEKYQTSVPPIPSERTLLKAASLCHFITFIYMICFAIKGESYIARYFPSKIPDYRRGIYLVRVSIGVVSVGIAAGIGVFIQNLKVRFLRRLFVILTIFCGIIILFVGSDTQLKNPPSSNDLQILTAEPTL